VIYRAVDGTRFEVCLIATHGKRRWALPKGHVEHGEATEGGGAHPHPQALPRLPAALGER
jgi:8-oxo-dGTP pyrophosphatase MutT (NUDIX family)